VQHCLTHWHFQLGLHFFLRILTVCISIIYRGVVALYLRVYGFASCIVHLGRSQNFPKGLVSGSFMFQDGAIHKGGGLAQNGSCFSHLPNPVRSLKLPLTECCSATLYPYISGCQQRNLKCTAWWFHFSIIPWLVPASLTVYWQINLRPVKLWTGQLTD